MIHSFTKASRSESKSILKIIKNGAKTKELQHVIEFAHEFGGIAYATEKAEHYSAIALNALEALPYSPSKESLVSFVDFVMERNK